MGAAGREVVRDPVVHEVVHGSSVFQRAVALGFRDVVGLDCGVLAVAVQVVVVVEHVDRIEIAL